jgi:hypothetical protein
MLELNGSTKEGPTDIFLYIILHVQVNILCNRYPVYVRKSNLEYKFYFLYTLQT